MSAGSLEGANSFSNGGGTFSDAALLWNNLDKMKGYDLILFSCEGQQPSAGAPALDAVKAYADYGGHLFMSHWHNLWIANEPTWLAIASWDFSGGNTAFAETETIDETNNPKGASFATWMLNVGGSSQRDQVVIQSGRETCVSVDNTKAQCWLIRNDLGTDHAQGFQFTTPNEMPITNRCGKVMFSDVHVGPASSSLPSTPFPMGCATSELTAQEKALAFMFFDLASCVNTTP